MPSKSYVPFEASRRHPPVAATRVGDVPEDEQVEISLYMKPREVSPVAGADHPREALRAARADAHQDDIRLITEFAGEHGLTVISVEPGRRLVRLSGSAGKVQAAFRTHLSYFH